MTLEEITGSFEQRFKSVVLCETGELAGPIAPNGRPFISYATGYEKGIGQAVDPRAIFSDELACLDHFAKWTRAVEIGEATTLYWRCRPEICEDHGMARRYVYCRMAFG